HPPGLSNAGKGILRTKTENWIAAPQLRPCRGGAVHRGYPEGIPFVQQKIAEVASQIRVAFAKMASNTGCKSPDELEMTRSTSDVAVCCSNASDSSRVRACTSSNRRTFSIAITAWSAKV